jgi:putative SOS response-associated peptidase YedK
MCGRYYRKGDKQKRPTARQSYTIITTDANELMASVHDRMPVILHSSDFNRWLDCHSDLA